MNRPKDLTGAAQAVLLILGVTLFVIIAAAVAMVFTGRTMPEKLIDLAPIIVAGLLGVLARTKPDPATSGDVHTVTTTVSKSPSAEESK